MSALVKQQQERLPYYQRGVPTEISELHTAHL